MRKVKVIKESDGAGGRRFRHNIIKWMNSFYIKDRVNSAKQ